MHEVFDNNLNKLLRFIHPPKVGGTSVQGWLKKRYGEKNVKTYTHATWDSIPKPLIDTIVFTTFRNPVERTASLFLEMGNLLNELEKEYLVNGDSLPYNLKMYNKGFDYFVDYLYYNNKTFSDDVTSDVYNNIPSNNHIYNNNIEKPTLNELVLSQLAFYPKNIPVYILRFSHLNHDWEQFCHIYKISFAPLPYLRVNANKDKLFYTSNTKQKIEELYKDDVDFFISGKFGSIILD